MDTNVDSLLSSMKNPEKYLGMLSIDDLNALKQGDLNAVSVTGLETLKRGQQDLGAGEYLDVGSSIAGALTGAGIGFTVGGPVGAVVGGVVGGAGGAFAGEVAEDIIAKREIDYSFKEGGAGYEAAQSAMWDTAFLGGGRIVRPIATKLGISPVQWWKRITGSDPGTITKPVTIPIEDFPRNSLESRQQIQRILTNEGGTLTGFQTGRAPWVNEFAEQIANVGFISRDILTKNAEKNTEILASGLQKLYQGIDPALTMTSSNLGEAVVDIAMTGKKLVSSYYGAGLEAIKSRTVGKVTSTDIINKTLSEFSQEAKDLLGTALRKNTERTVGDLSSEITRTSVIVNEAGNPFRLAKTTDVNALVRWQQDLTQAIEDLTPFYGNVSADAAAARQLRGLEFKIKDAITRTIARIDPKAALEYRELNKFYAKSMKSLLPKGISQKIVTAADRGLYTNIGNLLSGFPSDINQTKQLMKSIKSAFKIARKTKQKFTGDVNTQERATALVRQSFIGNRMADPATNSIDLKKLSSISEQLKTSKGAEVYQTILGDDYATFKTFVDAATLIADEPTQGVLSLAIRGREMGAVFQAAGAVTAGATMSPLPGLASAAVIFGLPIAAAKLATNKKAVNRMLMLDQVLKKNSGILPEALAAQLVKILDEFSDEDLEDIREGLF